MACTVDGNVIVLSGTVGDLYWEDSFCASDVIFALASVGRDQPVTIRINSGGGIATEGAAIHAAIAAHRGGKVVIVEGIAASAASVIAMAGDEVVMSPGAVMMVHDPSGYTFGTIEDHERQIAALTALATSMAGIYADKTGRSADEVRADMRTEIWMTPEEAVAAGYADRVLNLAPDAAPEPEASAFDYRLFAKAPERLVALADRQSWTNRAKPTAAAPPAPRPQETPPMPDPANPPAPPAPANPPAGSVARADAAEIARLCTAGGLATMVAALLTEGVTVEEAKTRITAAGEVKNLVALARRKDPSLPADLDATMLAEGKTVDQVRADLFNRMVASEARTSIDSHPPLPTGNADPAAAKASMQRQLARAGLVKKEG